MKIKKLFQVNSERASEDPQNLGNMYKYFILNVAVNYALHTILKRLYSHGKGSVSHWN